VTLVVTLFLAAVPFSARWQEEQELVCAAEEVASAIRETAAASTVKDARYPRSAGMTLHCEEEGGRVIYYATRGVHRTDPRGTLPKGIHMKGTAHCGFYFGNDGFAGRGSDYSLRLYSSSGRYHRDIVMALYTGRVRITNDARGKGSML
jgi:hypothetical protein